MAGRGRLGVAGAIAATMIGLLAVLSAFIIAELALIYQKYGLAAVQRVREGHEREKELLRIHYTDQHPLIAAVLGEGRRNVSAVGSAGESGYYTLISGHGYPVGIKHVLLVDRDNRVVKELRSVNMLVEPPCVIIDAKSIGFRQTGNVSVSFISSRGRIYQALEEPPSVADVIPCIIDSGSGRDGNSFDLKIEASPSQALGQVSVKVIVGTCQSQRNLGNQIRLDDCPPYTVAQLIAKNSDRYSFRYWQVEGKRYDTSELLILLEKDYNVVAKFDGVGGDSG